jgi:hypothetical protein
MSGLQSRSRYEHHRHSTAVGGNEGVVTADEGSPVSVESPETQMACAIAAEPKEIADQACVIGTDAQGNRIVLREGHNDFICQPGKPQFVTQPASCHTTNSKPRITYMLAGATQRSISHPDDKIGTLPRNRSTLDDHDAVRSQKHGVASHLHTGAYIMRAGTHSAHLHIMGRP